MVDTEGQYCQQSTILLRAVMNVIPNPRSTVFLLLQRTMLEHLFILA